MRWFSRSNAMLRAPFASLLTSILLVLPATVVALSTTGTRLLIIDEGETLQNYNGYVWDLEQRGFKITTLSPKAPELELFSYGERNYDHLLLLPPVSRAYGPKLSTQTLVEFLNNKGNILILMDPSSAPEQIRDLGRELDIGLAPRGDVVVDHFDYLPFYKDNDHAHNIIAVPKPRTNEFTKNYFGGYNDKEEVVAFRGTGHTLGNSPLIHPILSATRTTYSYDPKNEDLKSETPWSAGEQLHLTSGVQARNNARLTFVGSAELFGDQFQAIDGLRMGSKGYKEVVSNRAFANAVTAWTFQEIGVIRVDEVKYYPTDEPENVNPDIIRVKSDVTYEITLSEYSHDRWVPYVPPPSDSVQVEFTMLDPYYRLNLTPIRTTANSTTFSTSFTTPDQHGIFSFRTNYKRPYLSNIEHRKSVTVRHFAHDEYKRSWEISAAWVWLAGIAVTVVGWVAFVALWLWSAPTKAGRKLEAKKL